MKVWQMEIIGFSRTCCNNFSTYIKAQVENLNLTTSWIVRQVSTNFKGLKLHRVVYDYNIVKLEISNKN